MPLLVPRRCNAFPVALACYWVLTEPNITALGEHIKLRGAVTGTIPVSVTRCRLCEATHFNVVDGRLVMPSSSAEATVLSLSDNSVTGPTMTHEAWLPSCLHHVEIQSEHGVSQPCPCGVAVVNGSNVGGKAASDGSMQPLLPPAALLERAVVPVTKGMVEALVGMLPSLKPLTRAIPPVLALPFTNAQSGTSAGGRSGPDLALFDPATPLMVSITVSKDKKKVRRVVVSPAGVPQP